MNTRINIMAVTLSALGVLSGCAQTSPHWDKQFGTALRSALAAQVADPAAARNPKPVHGMDGRAAAAVQGRYEGSFVRPTEQQSIIGGSLR